MLFANPQAAKRLVRRMKGKRMPGGITGGRIGDDWDMKRIRVSGEGRLPTAGRQRAVLRFGMYHTPVSLANRRSENWYS